MWSLATYRACGDRTPRRQLHITNRSTFIVKRVIHDPEAGWLVKSDNPNKQAWPTRPWPEQARIVGEVRWMGWSFT